MSTFQRAQYVEVAKVIAKLDSLDEGERAYVAAKCAMDFLKDNSRFNDKRFYEAAGIAPAMAATLKGVAAQANTKVAAVTGKLSPDQLWMEV